MSKIYKGYELIKAIANGEIKEGTRFIDKTDTKYYEGTTVHTFKYQNNNFIQEKIGGINIVSILNHDFELIEEEQDIDIQRIEEFSSEYTMNNVEIQLQDKINQILLALKQLDRKIR